MSYYFFGTGTWLAYEYPDGMLLYVFFLFRNVGCKGMGWVRAVRRSGSHVVSLLWVVKGTWSERRIMILAGRSRPVCRMIVEGAEVLRIATASVRCAA